MDGGSKKRVRPDNAEVQPLEKAVKDFAIESNKSETPHHHRKPISEFNIIQNVHALTDDNLNFRKRNNKLISTTRCFSCADAG